MGSLEQGPTGLGSNQKAPHEKKGKAGVADRRTMGIKKPIRTRGNQRAGGPV